MSGNVGQKQVYIWWSADGINMVPVTLANPLPIQGSISATNPSVGLTGATAPTSATEIGIIDGTGKLQGASSTNPVPVSVSTIPLPTGAATEATLSAFKTANHTDLGVLNTTLGTPIQTTGGTVGLVAGSAVIGHVITDTGSTTAVTGTVAISAASLPLPTGASTAAKQPALGIAGSASSDVLTIQGIASMTKLLVTPDSVALPANQSVNVAQINGVTPLMGAGNTGTGSPRVTTATDNAAIPTWGHGATAASVPANTTYKGLRGTTANPTAVTDGQLVGAMGDKVGRQVVVPFAPRDLVGQQKTTLSNTTSETTIVTAVTSTFLDVLSFNFVNSGSTATKVDIRDDTAGTIRATFFVPATDMRGQTYTLPFTQTAVNKNWTAQCSAATTALEVTVQFVKNL